MLRRHIVTYLLCLFSGSFLSANAQSPLEIEGAFGFGLGESQPYSNMLISARIHYNTTMSSTFGLGLWESGYNKQWLTEASDAKTIFHLYDGKTLPIIQSGIKIQHPIGKIGLYPISIGVEPFVTFLPFSARTAHLEETYFSKDDAASTLAGKDIFERTGSADFAIKSACHPRVYVGGAVHFSTIVKESIRVQLGFGYTTLDLFKDLRTENLHGVPLNEHLPKSGIKYMSLAFSYHNRTNQ